MVLTRSTQGTSYTNSNVVHVLRDGTRLDTIAGYKVPNDSTVYQVMERLRP